MDSDHFLRCNDNSNYYYYRQRCARDPMRSRYVVPICNDLFSLARCSDVLCVRKMFVRCCAR